MTMQWIEEAEANFDEDCDCYNCERLRMESYWDGYDEAEDNGYDEIDSEDDYPNDISDAEYEDYWSDARMAYWD